MSAYALLLLPSSNRVYAGSSIGLLRAELEIFGETVLSAAVSDIAEERLGGVPYLTFEAAPALSERDVAYLSNLSGGYALFERADGLLRPVELNPLAMFDDDLLTIQKYTGKTNEQFTKLLLNVTLLGSAYGPELLDRRLRVLDPLCGRGTTLNQALMYGYDASGIDIDGKDFEAYSGFLRTWLKRKRIKHKAETTPVRRDRKLLGRRLHIDIGMDKDAYKRGERLDLTVINADTVRAREFFRPNSFDVLVADLPYGVQHGSHGTGHGTSHGTSHGSRGASPTLSRAPLDLLGSALQGWVELLRPGGALGLSWNIYVAERDQLAATLTEAGLTVRDSPPYSGFRHRVDQAITRDLVVAAKLAQSSDASGSSASSG